MNPTPHSSLDFQEWLLHPTTQAFRRVLVARVRVLKDRWAAGEFSDMSQFGTAILNAKAIGAVEAYEGLAALDFEVMEMELSDDSEK